MERSVLIQGQRFAAKVRNNRHRIATDLNQHREIQPRGEPLPEGQVEVRSGRLDGRSVFAVLDLSNYGGDGSRNMNRASQGAGITKKMAGEGFIHNHDGGRSRLIAFGEVPSLEHTDAHKLKVARGHGGAVDQHLLAGRRYISFHHKLILWTGVGHGQWDIVGVGNTVDAGLGLQSAREAHERRRIVPRRYSRHWTNRTARPAYSRCRIQAQYGWRSES